MIYANQSQLSSAIACHALRCGKLVTADVLPHTCRYIYVDDYLSYRGCKRAVDEFRLARNIAAPLHVVLETGGQIEAVWWRKPDC